MVWGDAMAGGGGVGNAEQTHIGVLIGSTGVIPNDGELN